ncbi:hypothetical protein FOZG_08128 [Fusarium oxysporum Fo47]|uniref:Uncharacterized protein n=1 Tax=Fusarium oxysporum Fo47 TaxID=660027 RepID=W9K3B0_FUSOX|nr:hypothetical protein FOZG_08128 [Fusarium oxysporum Fo47]
MLDLDSIKKQDSLHSHIRALIFLIIEKLLNLWLSAGQPAGLSAVAIKYHNISSVFNQEGHHALDMFF